MPSAYPIAQTEAQKSTASINSSPACSTSNTIILFLFIIKILHQLGEQNGDALLRVLAPGPRHRFQPVDLVVNLPFDSASRLTLPKFPVHQNGISSSVNSDCDCGNGSTRAANCARMALKNSSLFRAQTMSAPSWRSSTLPSTFFEAVPFLNVSPFGSV